MGRHSFPGPDDFDDEPLDPDQDWDAAAPDPFGFGDPDDDEYVDDYQDAFYDEPIGGDAGYDADPAQYMRRGSGSRSEEETRYRTGPFGAPGALPSGSYPDREAERDQPRRGRRELERWRRHRNDAGRRGVSVGVIAALIAVIVLVGTVILWRFFGNSLSQRSAIAAGNCAHGDLTVAVVADPSIADHVQGFADRFNKTAKPVGDRCVSVQVKPVDSDAVVSGFIGDWPAQLGQRPALWIPGSSISAARLQASAGQETVSDSRSLVTSPVLLAVRPQLESALQHQNWANLPDLQTDPDGLGRLGLAGWGQLRLALPIGGNGDAAFLAGEAVASGAAPKGAPATDGTGAVHRLAGAQPHLADNSLAEAMNVLLRQGDSAAAPVHAVVTTEQQLFTRGQSLSDPASTLGSWLPPGPVPVADYPTVLLAGSWLSQEQVSAASEFARFARKPDQLADLAKAGFRVEGVAPPSSDVTGFPALPDTLSVGDDAMRATLANALTTLPGASAVTIMLDESMTTDEGGKTRLAHVVAALDQRIKALPPSSVVGLWTFDGVEGHSVLASGPLDEPVNGGTRAETLTRELDALSSTSGGAVSFTTLRLVYNQVLANYHPGQTNSVLVITAGPHTDRTLDGPGLQDFIRANTDPERPVAVNVIDFGDADRAVWQAVAQLSGGTYQNLRGANTPELAGTLNTLLG
ncbi:MAG: substrate-binding domain-containing protein [Mycolicibacter algericus]|uniref:substrate-binding domain-containing protein n=1 Tax=Mycolicibacter algericus TaxID=1288388 RepID=UPI003C74E81E